jgi:hypothetical protein
MTLDRRHLVVLGCSSTKFHATGDLPAIQRYDGPMYRVLRTYLRETLWPSPLSVAVLSAKYGLIGGLTPIADYDQRMDRGRAAELMPASTETLLRWSETHKQVSFVLGKDYLPAVNLDRLAARGIQPQVIEGPIGAKQSELHHLLRRFQSHPRPAEPTALDRPLYFLPDWDDMLDVEYDFASDTFSAPHRSSRSDKHCIEVMHPQRICDGVLVSLAQHVASKGVLKRYRATDIQALAPEPMRQRFGLSSDQLLFGDCGAFSYANDSEPTITTEHALSLYQLHGFDFGASVDHIPLPVIATPEGKRPLSAGERSQRVALTKANAEAFLSLHKQRKCTFIPVGIIQALTPEDYASQLREYVDMGYRHVALGGLVPKSDDEVVQVMELVGAAKQSLGKPLWIHLFGIFRPKIQDAFRHNGVTSFDSATYFRKAWLRSDQNYLGADGNWYAAIRVPMTSDPRTVKRLEATGANLDKLKTMESEALAALHEYGRGARTLEQTLRAVLNYDRMLSRSSDDGDDLESAYRRTLRAKPWSNCKCPVCESLGIDVLIFRGSNRNKRRGSHNTAQLYHIVGKTAAPSPQR